MDIINYWNIYIFNHIDAGGDGRGGGRGGGGGEEKPQRAGGGEKCRERSSAKNGKVFTKTSLLMKPNTYFDCHLT